MGVLRSRATKKKGSPAPPVEAYANENQKTKFLNALQSSVHFDVKHACDSAKIAVRYLPKILDSDVMFRSQYDEIKAAFNASLERLAHERASKAGGDNLLWKLLQINMPEKYGGGNDAIRVNVTADELAAMTDEELEAIRCKLRKS